MMNCKSVRIELGLRVGADHDPRLEGQVQRHLAECPQCRKFAEDVKSSSAVLRKVANASPEIACESVWPGIRNHLPVPASTVIAREQRGARSQWAGWLSVAALAAACVAVMVVSSNTPVFDYNPDQSFATGNNPVFPAFPVRQELRQSRLRPVDVDHQVPLPRWVREGHSLRGLDSQPELVPVLNPNPRSY